MIHFAHINSKYLKYIVETQATRGSFHIVFGGRIIYLMAPLGNNPKPTHTEKASDQPALP